MLKRSIRKRHGLKNDIQDRTSQRQLQDRRHSVIEVARRSNNEEARAQTVANSSTEPVLNGRSLRPQSSPVEICHCSPMIGRDDLVKRVENRREGQEKDNSQEQASTWASENAVVPQSHCVSRFEPSQHSALQINADETRPRHGVSSQRNGFESIDLGIIDGFIADLGARSPKVPGDSRRTRHLHLLNGPVNSGNPGLTNLASSVLEAQVFATAKISQNPGSHSGQAWDSPHLEPERGHTEPASRPHTPGQGDSPTGELCRTISRDFPHAGSTDSSHSARLRSRGPSALKPLYTGQPQGDSRKALPNFQGELLQQRTIHCLPSVLAKDRTREEGSNRLYPANRSAGGRDRTNSSSTRETQGPRLGPACINCRKKKTRCDRRRPRCEWMSIRGNLTLADFFRWELCEAG